MTLNARYSVRDGVAVVELSGEISAPDWIEAFRGLLDQSGVRAETPTVWDFRSTSGAGELSATDFHAIGAAIRKGRTSTADAPRVAMVTATELDFGMARKFELSSEAQIPIRLRVFRELEEAISWAAGAD